MSAPLTFGISARAAHADCAAFFLNWAATNQKAREIGVTVGGSHPMGPADAYMPPVRAIVDALRADPSWKIVAPASFRTAVVRKEMPKVLFVISHSIAEQRYMIHAVPVSADSFDARADLPASWAGLRDADLARVTGVADATFCHNGRFIAAAKSYEGIYAMALQALQDVEPKPAP